MAEFGVVDKNWADRTWSSNLYWDYAYYVVDDTDAHQGPVSVNDALDEAVDTLPIDFTSYTLNAYGYALGYPYNRDPDFRYCADILGSRFGGYIMDECNLGGGASGGPWINPFDLQTGSGPIISGQLTLLIWQRPETCATLKLLILTFSYLFVLLCSQFIWIWYNSITDGRASLVRNFSPVSL